MMISQINRIWTIGCYYASPAPNLPAVDRIESSMSSDHADEVSARDRRRTDRRRVLKAGIIAFNNRHSALPCAIRDLSETGARLALNGPINAPDTFELIVELDGIEASCKVISRRGSELRVQFLASPRIVVPRRTQVVQATTAAKPASLRRK